MSKTKAGHCSADKGQAPQDSCVREATPFGKSAEISQGARGCQHQQEGQALPRPEKVY